MRPTNPISIRKIDIFAFFVNFLVSHGDGLCGHRGRTNLCAFAIVKLHKLFGIFCTYKSYLTKKTEILTKLKNLSLMFDITYREVKII